MTTERRKALLMMGATFALGVLIGVLGTGLLARKHYRNGNEHQPGNGKEMRQGPRGNFANKIYKVVEADSAQIQLMKPILQETMVKIDSLQAAGDRDVHAEMEVLKQKLNAILKPAQIERLEKFISRKHRSGGERGSLARDRKRD